jgi:hypothetical protein
LPLARRREHHAIGDGQQGVGDIDRQEVGEDAAREQKAGGDSAHNVADAP